MIDKIKKLFRFKKKKSVSDYKLLKECLENINISKKDFDKEITTLYDNIEDYITALEILRDHDYSKSINRLTLPRMNEVVIPFKKFITDHNGYVYLNYDELVKRIIELTIDLIEIYDILKTSKDSDNFFNLRILEIYITNVKKIVQQLNLC